MYDLFCPMSPVPPVLIVTLIPTRAHWSLTSSKTSALSSRLAKMINSNACTEPSVRSLNPSASFAVRSRSSYISLVLA